MSLTTEQIEEERLKLEQARLAFEKRQALYRLLAVLGACATFIWTAFTYFDQAALDIAHECREELARSWNTEAWTRK